MPKTLKLGVLAKRIQDLEATLAHATTVESIEADGTTKKVSKAKLTAAIAALKNADTKLSRVCQQGVFGVKVSP